jgi:hypothetical protein
LPEFFLVEGLETSFGPKAQNPGIPHVRSGLLPYTSNKEMVMVKGRARDMPWE